MTLVQITAVLTFATPKPEAELSERVAAFERLAEKRAGCGSPCTTLADCRAAGCGVCLLGGQVCISHCIDCWLLTCWLLVWLSLIF